jgi:transposase InsO family protein
VADLSEVSTWEGKLYLAVVIDCFSRRVVGWAMAEHMRSELVVEALEMAVARRRPSAGLVHHSDQGSPGSTSRSCSASAAARRASRCRWSKGSALDNAVCESFFATLKKELTRRRSWPTRSEARSAIFEWIESWYDRRRLHSTLGYLSPMNYEQSILERKEMKEAA